MSPPPQDNLSESEANRLSAQANLVDSLASLRSQCSSVLSLAQQLLQQGVWHEELPRLIRELQSVGGCLASRLEALPFRREQPSSETQS